MTPLDERGRDGQPRNDVAGGAAAGQQGIGGRRALHHLAAVAGRA